MNLSNDSSATSFLLQEDSSLTVQLVIDALVLLVSFLVLVLDVLILLALFRDSKTDKIVRVLFGNIVLTSLIACIISIVRHSLSLAIPFQSDVRVPFCKAIIELFVAAESSRMLLTLTYAVVVVLVIRFWNKPVLSPRNVKYFIMVVIGLWCAAAVVAIPLAFDDVNGTCAEGRYEEGAASLGLFLYTGLHGLLIIIAPMVITVSCVIASYCYTKRYNTVKESTAIIRFAIFVIFDQFIVLLCHIGALAALAASITLAHFIVSAMTDLSLIGTPILILTLLRPTRRKLLNWFCCCCHKQ